MRRLVSKLTRKIGYDIIRYKPNKEEQVAKFLRATGINTVFDVGANIGQFAQGIRKGGYNGAIHSFEPMKDQYEELSANCLVDEFWNPYKFAFGDSNRMQDILIANNIHGASSSFLPFTNLTEHEVGVKTVSKEQVEIKTIDSFLKKEDQLPTENMLLKLDVQGYEYAVLEGAKKSLRRFSAVLLESSLFALYENEKLAADMIVYLKEKGYMPVAFFVEIESDIGTTLQSDILFVTNNLYKKLESRHE